MPWGWLIGSLTSATATPASAQKGDLGQTSWPTGQFCKMVNGNPRSGRQSHAGRKIDHADPPTHVDQGVSLFARLDIERCPARVALG